MNTQPIEMPGLLYGTAWKKERTASLVEQAVKAGFRGIDTACQPKHYHEAGVGEALAKLAEVGIGREELYLQTKFTPLPGHDPRQVPYDPGAPLAEQVAQSFVVSRQNLGVDRVDGLLLHSPLLPHKTLMTAWRAMEHIVQTGGARGLGISNCYDLEILQALHADAEIKPTVVQNRFYPQTDYDLELRRWAKDHGIVYQSFWTLTANPHLLLSDPLQAMARERGKTEEQILFRYLTQIGIVPLTGTTSATHMEQDLDIFHFRLEAPEMERIAALFPG